MSAFTARRFFAVSACAVLLGAAAVPRAHAQSPIASSSSSFSSTSTSSNMTSAATNSVIQANLRPTVRVAGLPIFAPSVANQQVNPGLYVAPGLTLAQAAFNTRVVGRALRSIPPYALLAGSNPYGAGASLSAAGYGASPYGYGGGYGYGGYGYYEDPYTGYLRGAAEVTNADGKYLSQVQQARLLQAQADSAKLDLRRRIADEAAVERRNWLNPEADRVRALHAAYERATREPPVSEILSGQAINDLYNHILHEQMKGIKGPDVPLNDDMLRQVNLVGVGSNGSVAFLKDRGRLNWPLALQDPAFDEPRKEFTALAADAVNQARLNNTISAGMIRDMLGDVRRMNETLLRHVADVSPSDYVDAKRFLGGLESAVRALQDPNVANQLNQNWSPHARTVAELTDFMSQRGLRFGPAAPGDEPAYRSLYDRLLSYDTGISELVTKNRPATGSR